MANNQHTLYKDYYDNTEIEQIKQFLFDDYAQENGWATIDDVDDDEIYKFLDAQHDDDWQELEFELEKLFKHNYAIIVGTLGLWYGRVDGGKFINNVGEFIEMLKDNTKIYDKDGHLFIETSHHDGTNYYEMKLLTKKGVELAENNGFRHDRKLHQTIFNNNFYSKLPKLYDKLWK